MKTNTLFLSLGVVVSLSYGVLSSVWADDQPLSSVACEEEYLALFSDTKVDVTVALGYFDVDTEKADGSVTKTLEDGKGRAAFKSILLKSCAKRDEKMCGFKLVEESPDRYRKELLGPQGQPFTLTVTVSHSSISNEDAKNRNDPAQKELSARAKEIFLDGIRNSEITIYSGHSRDGGGPDFDPPIMDTKGHTNYDYYHAHPADRSAMLNALKENPAKRRLLILDSCSSNRWFGSRIDAVTSSTGLFATSDTSYGGGGFLARQMVAALEHVFNYECVAELQLPDSRNFAVLKSYLQWKVPTEIASLTEQETEKNTLAQLTANLKSSHPWVREQSIWELNQYPKAKLSSEVLKAIQPPPPPAPSPRPSPLPAPAPPKGRASSDW